MLVLLTGLAAAAVLGYRQQFRNEQVIAAHADAVAEQAADDLEQRFQAYEYGLRGLRDAVIDAGGLSITHHRFQQLAPSRELEPGSLGYGLVVREPRKGESAFVLKYFEPETPNAPAIGLDIASAANRRDAATQAMASGHAVLTAPATDTGRSQGGLLLLPIYKGTSQHPARGATTGIGWVCTALVIDKVLADVGGRHIDYGITLTDVTEPQQPPTFLASNAALKEVHPAWSRARIIPIYGRQWRLEIVPSVAAVARLKLAPPLYVFIAIGALASLLAIVFLILGAKRGSSAQRARLAAIVESSHDAIVGTGLDGRVTEWNPAAVQMFGYTANEAIGRSLVELIVPFERVKEDSEILLQVAKGAEVSAMETSRRHRKGSLLPVEIAASPIRGRRGKVVGVGLTLRDIAARKEAHAEILQHNVTLEQQVEESAAEIQAYTALQRAILTGAGYAIIAADPKGTITLFNPAAETMLGYASADVVGKVTPEIFHDQIEMAERAHSLQRELGRRIPQGFDVLTAKAGTEPDAHEWTYINKAGNRIPVLVTVSALRKADGELLGYLSIAADLRERKRREAALETNERKLRGLFELSPLGIVLADERGRFVEFNEAFRVLTDYSEEELKALDPRVLTPREYESQERALLRQVDRIGRYGPYEKHFIRKDGTRVPIRLNGVALRINDRPFTWSLVEDITIQRAAEAAMVDAVAAAEAASKAKSDFLANMSHEIRTPMNAILGMLQLLRKTKLDPRQKDYAAKTETAAKALLDILNDILDFSKIEAGRQTLEAHEFELEQVLRDISVILSANIGDKDIELIFDIDERVPKQVIGDSLRLQQVLINLVGNAIKFTEFGEVVLAVHLRGQAGGHATLDFEVRDTGIGIDQDKLAAIFEGFSQAEASTTRRFGGTGLGLAISQRLVRLMGGELKVESERGQGSRFFFSITLDVPGTATPSATAPQRLGKLRALVVDDNDSARAAIVSMVQSIGWHADGIASGEAALERIRQVDEAGEPYQVIFLDWRMPGLDGWETGHRIRQLHTGKEGDTPLIIMVTAHGREMLAERRTREQEQLDGFLIKPVTMAMLIDAVADASAGHGTIAATSKPAQAPSMPTSERLAGTRILAVDDNPINQQLVAELLRSEGAQVTVAGGGAQAVSLLKENADAFDIVLMDIQMPDMDGYAATRRIRMMPRLKKMPIIAMTANVLPADREACLAAGMNDHVGKPFVLDALVERLLHWAGRAPAPRPAAAPSPMPQAQEGELPILDWQAALDRFGGKRWVYAETLRSFPDALTELLQKLEHSVREQNRESVARHLHTLKGIAATVGASKLAQRVKVSEKAAGIAQTDWIGALSLNTLRASIGEAIATSRAVFTTLFTEGAEDSTVPATAVSREALEELRTLLAASNLRALDEFRALETALSRAHREEHREMQDALARLDFPTAANVCEALLRGHAQGSERL